MEHFLRNKFWPVAYWVKVTIKRTNICTGIIKKGPSSSMEFRTFLDAGIQAISSTPSPNIVSLAYLDLEYLLWNRRTLPLIKDSWGYNDAISRRIQFALIVEKFLTYEYFILISKRNGAIFRSIRPYHMATVSRKIYILQWLTAFLPKI